MAKNDIILIDNPTVMGIQRKLEDHDDRFDEHDRRFDKLEADISDVKVMVRRIQDKLLPLLDKIAAM